MIKNRLFLLLLASISLFSCNKQSQKEVLEIESDTLLDKIKGAMVGQLLGNLNGLPYEETYNNEPGEFTNYVPSLVPGAYTDDDTDIEWSYIIYMEKEDTLFLSDSSIREMWIKHMSRDIYSSNYYARELMKMGMSPRLTGNIFVNPWASFNVVGQFNCETFALIAPGMCQTAEEIAMHYTSVIVDQEPIQSTQIFAAMVARAFVTNNLNDILQTGIEALDKNSKTYEAVMDAIEWVKQYPNDWKTARKEMRKKYYFSNQYNKSLTNTSAIIAQYLYGQGEFVKTMEIAFNWGFDADCNAATIASILGAIKGYHWFEQNGWDIRDIYCNKNRKGLPMDETITRFSERILKLADKAILSNGGLKETKDGKTIYTIALQKPSIIEKVSTEEKLFKDFENTYKQKIADYFAKENSDTSMLAVNTYLSYVLKTAEDIRDINRSKWEKGVEEIKKHNEFLWCVNHASDNYIKNFFSKHNIVFKQPEPQMDGKQKFKLSGFNLASKVFVVGTINDWKAWQTPMLKTADGWACAIDLNPGKYEYKFIIDGKAIFDPGNTQQIVNECDGSTNSLLIVK